MSNTNCITIDQKKSDQTRFINDHALYSHIKSLTARHYNRKLARILKKLHDDGMKLEMMIEKFELKQTKQSLSKFILKYGGEQ